MKTAFIALLADFREQLHQFSRPKKSPFLAARPQQGIWITGSLAANAARVRSIATTP
jgi:hypothetical protein